MKNIILLLFVLAISLGGHAQSLKNTIAKPELMTFASARMNIPAQPQPLPEECKRYKTMRDAGIGTAAGSGALFIIGIALVAVGENNFASGTQGAVGEINGGAAMLTFGILGMGAGIPLAVIGAHRYNDSCKSARLELHTASHGTGLALNF